MDRLNEVRVTLTEARFVAYPNQLLQHNRPLTGSNLFDHLFESGRRAYRIPTSSCPAAASSA